MSRKSMSVETLEPRRLFSVPVLANLPSYSIPIGKTIQVPLVTDTADGSAVTYAFRTSTRSVSLSLHPSTNTFVSIDVAGYGDPMVFELFNDIAPNTVRRFTGLVNSGYYDGLTFHRVINNFEIQSGDPTGTGLGGVADTIDDEFDPNTLFSGTGQLAMANSGQKDSNGSQFFITEGSQRLLDFNYTIFGQLIRGETTRAAISDVAVDGSNRPLTPVTITDAKVIADATDAVLTVKSLSAAPATIRVTATTSGGSAVQSFSVQPFTDTYTDPPIMNAIPKAYYIDENAQLTTTLTSTDLQGQVVDWRGNRVQGDGLADAYIHDQADGSGLLVVTPQKDFTGVITLIVGVGIASATTRGNLMADSTQPLGGLYDTQLVTVVVGRPQIAVTGYDCALNSGAPNTGLPIASFRDSDTSKSADSFTATISWGDGTAGTGTVVASRHAGSYTVLADKTYGASASGDIPVNVTITDSDGQVATAQSTVAVHNYASLVAGLLTVYGTSGNDRISVGRKGQYYAVSVNGASQAFAIGDVAMINLYALAGRDGVVLTAAVTTPAYLDGGDGNDTIYGGGGPDIINGGAGNDYIQCGDGGNRVAGGDGDDTLLGGNGRDRIFGGDGNDYLYGGPGRDILSGDAGNDTVLGGTSNDILYGGDGDDILNGMGGTDLISGGPGYDTAKSNPLDTFNTIEHFV